VDHRLLGVLGLLEVLGVLLFQKVLLVQLLQQLHQFLLGLLVLWLR